MKKILTLAPFIALISCSSIETPVKEQTIYELSTEEKENLLSWKEMQPSLKRLVVIESELIELLSTLRQTIQEKEAASAITVAPLPPVKDIAVVPLPPVEAISKSPQKKHALQLFATKTLEELNLQWGILKQKHAESLSDLPVKYERAEVGQQIYYRLKVGEFTTKEKANFKCKALLTVPLKCFVVSSAGEYL